MNIGLPDTDGVQLTRQFRSLPETAGTPIICVSSFTGGVKAELRDAGCSGLFSETAFISNYAETIKKYIG